MRVRTRFAPSPTGYMHIGGMRTALFNWLLAKRHGGQFLLRIDDTDGKRNMDEALGPILRAFKWLGLNWDEGPEIGGPHAPYFQSQRGHLYKAAAEKLEASGHAYRDYATKEEIETDRKQADKEKRPYVNIRRSLNLTDEMRSDLDAQGRPWVLRLLVPRDRKLKLQDMIRGEVEWDCGLLPDPVILRGDGSPLYNFATVIDDADTEITHVVRAEEHLSNTPIQLLVYEALGLAPPQFAHVPYVAAPGSKEKISKRKVLEYRKNPHFKKMFERGDQVFGQIGLGDATVLNPVMVEYYERIGYLPVSVINALGRIGWSLDDSTEILSLQTLIDSFTLDRVVKAPASLDPDKMFNFQGHWMKELPLADKVTGCLTFLTAAKLVTEPVTDADRLRVEAAVVALGDRLKLFSDILDLRWYFSDEYAIDESNFAKRVVKSGVLDHLRAFRNCLVGVEPFDTVNLEAALQAYCQETGQDIGKLVHALRASVTGQPVGPGAYDCLALVGRERSLQRIDSAIARAERT